MKERKIEYTPRGKNLFEDSRGRYFIKDKKNKCVYQISKSELNTYRFYENRYAIPALITVVIGFYFSWKLALVVLAVGMVLMEYVYQNFYLKNLIEVSIILPEVKLQDVYKDAKNGQNIIRACIAFAFPFLLFYYLVFEYGIREPIQAESIILLIVCVVGSLYSLRIFVASISAVLKEKRG